MRPTFRINKSVGGELDPELIPILNKLNSIGLKTVASNYGRRSTYPRSWIAFSRVLNPNELKLALETVRDFGFTVTELKSWTKQESGHLVRNKPYTMYIKGKTVSGIEFID